SWFGFLAAAIWLVGYLQGLSTNAALPAADEVVFNAGTLAILLLTAGKMLVFSAMTMGSLLWQSSLVVALASGIGVLFSVMFFRKKYSCRLTEESRILLDSFILFGLGSALLVGFGRYWLGFEFAVSDRYTTLVMPLWIAWLLYFVLWGSGKSSRYFVYAIVLVMTVNSIMGVG